MRRLIGCFLIACAACSTNQQGPDSPCAAVNAQWPQEYVDMENALLELVNLQRSLGANCGPVSFGPLPALHANEHLACAARGHAKDMVVNNYFSHNTQSGENPFDRMTDAGYLWRSAGENIAGGFTDAAATLSAFMSDEGHCTNVMGDYVDIGIGFYPNDWVQDFGSPR